MPYIVTKYRHEWRNSHTCTCPSSAVATLEEQQVYNALYRTPIRDKLDAAQRIAQLPESGGSITLPDGTVIEVTLTTEYGLRDRLGWTVPAHATLAEIIDAYNARQEA